MSNIEDTANKIDDQMDRFAATRNQALEIIKENLKEFAYQIWDEAEQATKEECNKRITPEYTTLAFGIDVKKQINKTINATKINNPYRSKE